MAQIGYPACSHSELRNLDRSLCLLFFTWVLTRRASLFSPVHPSSVSSDLVIVKSEQQGDTTQTTIPTGLSTTTTTTTIDWVLTTIDYHALCRSIVRRQAQHKHYIASIITDSRTFSFRLTRSLSLLPFSPRSTTSTSSFFLFLVSFSRQASFYYVTLQPDILLYTDLIFAH